ncbi:CHAP domain-containing protein [Planomonospora sp. ID67723]|uniref:CHAP domain-containing protein n=1 Tax=Planomonospora sp. ID67723 TaxID=2738134 RepID=UPI0018C3BB1E|nr:CHAP domain-containing protein [Planomonospora sp. ID67723]MBG0830293.1 CHAP domain-containing protein [Planomonospora sp. ID67723]
MSAGLALAGVIGFAVLPAAAAAADTPGITDDLSAPAPFAEMQARIAEIETELQALQDPAAFAQPQLSGTTEATDTTTATTADRARTAELPALDSPTALDPSQALKTLESLARGAQNEGTSNQGTSNQGTSASGGARVQQMITAALSKVGEGEASDGTTFYGKWYNGYTKQKGFAAAPWCDMFLGWVAVQYGLQDQMGVFAYTPWHAEWFRKQGRFDRKPRVGDLVFFDWGGSKNISAIDHIGMVTGVNPDGSVSTVEGNVSDKVVTRTRTMGTIVGFGHPAYGG